MKNKAIILVVLAVVWRCEAGLILSDTPYLQSFDAIGSGWPSEWSVNTGADGTSLGTGVAVTTTKSYWSAPSAGFYNVASADQLSSSSTTTDQNNSADRALAVRQTAASGYDPGAAIVLQIQNTTGYRDFALSLKAQMLDENLRSTTWTFDYRLGDVGSFTYLGAYSDPGQWGSTAITFNSTQLASWNDQSSAVYFRIAALAASSGSSSRDMFGIDDFSLTFTPIPEPTICGVVAAIGLLGLAGLHSWRLRRRPA